MTRTLEQILTDQKIEISPRLIRTPEATIAVGDGWIVSEYNWPAVWPAYFDGPSAPAIAMLIASVWILASPIPPDMPWLVPVAVAVAVGAAWSIGSWALNRWARPTPAVGPSRGLTFAVSMESSVTIFSSDDEQEIQLLRRKLENTLLSNRTNGD